MSALDMVHVGPHWPNIAKWLITYANIRWTPIQSKGVNS